MAAVIALSRHVLSLQYSLEMGRLGWEQTSGRLGNMFAEVWMRIMVFGVVSMEAARNMADAHYTLFAPALRGLGISREFFTVVLTPELAGEPWRQGSGTGTGTGRRIARVGWSRAFPSACPDTIDHFHV